MSRLIDADAFKEYMRKALEETRGYYPDKGEWAEAITEQFCKDIDDQPTVEPERKKGKWIAVDDYFNRISGRCSACGWEAHMYEDDVVGMNYCPNCGADMRGEEYNIPIEYFENGGK